VGKEKLGRPKLLIIEIKEIENTISMVILGNVTKSGHAKRK